MPRIHEREALTNKALVELLEWLDQWAKRHQLTHLEKLIALRDTANHYVDTYFKHELRYERHGDADTPAGWAKDKPKRGPLSKLRSGKPPWQQANAYGEYPGDICCQRATGQYCYEHDPANYDPETWNQIRLEGKAEPEAVNGCGQFLRTCKCGHPEHAHLMRPAPGYETGCQVCDCKTFEPAGG
jgi:hypothetical protein